MCMFEAGDFVKRACGMARGRNFNFTYPGAVVFVVRVLYCFGNTLPLCFALFFVEEIFRNITNKVFGIDISKNLCYTYLIDRTRSMCPSITERMCFHDSGFIFLPVNLKSRLVNHYIKNAFPVDQMLQAIPNRNDSVVVDIRSKQLAKGCGHCIVVISVVMPFNSNEVSISSAAYPSVTGAPQRFNPLQ